MAQMNGAQALTRQLEAEGVDTVFALPGAQIMSAFDAMYEVRDEISLIQTRHEQATTYMADGYAKVTGKPGVAMVVPGPGALNAAAGLGTAYACSSPVLLISGQIPSMFLGKNTGQLHEISEQLDVFRPITKWNHRVTSAGEIPSAVHEAFRQMTTGRPGPVELEIPPDILSGSDDIALVGKETFPHPTPNMEDIAAAAILISKSQQPAIIAGGGVVASGAHDQIRKLAELLQAPVMTTPLAKGVIPERNHLATGVNSAIGPASMVLSDSDLLIAVGTRLSLRGVSPENMPTLVHIDVEKSQIGQKFTPEVGLVGDAAECLDNLISKIEMPSVDKGQRSERAISLKEEFSREVSRLAPEQVSVIDKISSALTHDTIVVQGMTNIGYWSSEALPMSEPRNYVSSSYFGTLGYVYPTALGSQAAFPDRPVVALCGDGGFMYSPQELSTAVKYGLNTIALVFNNGAFGASRWDQEHAFNGRYIGTDLHNPDFVMLAQAFGATGIRTDTDGIGEAITKAMSVNSPAVIDVEIDNMMPPFQIVE